MPMATGTPRRRADPHRATISRGGHAVSDSMLRPRLMRAERAAYDIMRTSPYIDNDLPGRHHPTGRAHIRLNQGTE